MISFRKLAESLVAVMLLLTLAACGDTATSVPAISATTAVSTMSGTTATNANTSTLAAIATTTTANTSAIAVSDATTAIPTVIANTTMATTTNVVTVVNTPAANNGGSSNFTNNIDIPSISGLNEVPINQSILDYINETTGQAMSKTQTNIKFVGFKCYGSNDDVATVDNNIDQTLTAAGYKYVAIMPNTTKLVSTQGRSSGLYTKSGSPDLVISVLDAQSTASMSTELTPVAGKTLPAGIQDLESQLKSKKTVVAVIAARGYADLFTNAMATGTAAQPKK